MERLMEGTNFAFIPAITVCLKEPFKKRE